MASKAEAITALSPSTSVSQSLKVQMKRFAGAARRWGAQGQLGSSSITDLGRHTGARI